MPEYTPTYLPGTEVTFTAGADIVGGQVVVLSTDNTVIPSAGGSNKVVGIATNDTKAGARLTVSRGGVQNPLTTAAIAAGTSFKSAAAGKIAAWVSGTDPADQLLGFTLTTAAAADARPDVSWRA
ncbi:capsid cement protein [Kineosporia babensis]|uniref:DUF2190 family protein n=1 Tax=Kineosporia babensis TaxID=499548 RepID=A0A9X1NB14_9ACTN|nr:capsid cement protein [Kineosporia babensis]MCD5310805.1 DUF2190 family protein [Kineosporia babensis]